MTNELVEKGTLKKVTDRGRVSYRLDDNVEAVWMSQEELAEFFCVSRKEIVLILAKLFKEEIIIKEDHTRRIHYVSDGQDKGQAKQVVQYDLEVIIQCGIQLTSEEARQFQAWITHQIGRLLRWGVHIDPARIKPSDKRKKQLNRTVERLLKS